VLIYCNKEVEKALVACFLYAYMYGFCKMFLYKKSEEEFLYSSLFSLLFSKSYF